MKRLLTVFLLIIAMMSIMVVQAQEEDETQVLADFEVEELFLGKDSDNLDIGFVAWGDAAENVMLNLVPSEGDLALPEQDGDNTVLEVAYDINGFGGFTHVFTDGEEWVAQDWTAYNALDFWLYGANSEAMIQVEIFDNRAPEANSDSAERFYYRITDDFEGWQFFSIPFEYFQRRTDWQPGGAPVDGFGLTEVHAYAFSFPPGAGAFTNYIDNVMVSTGEGNVEPPGSAIVEEDATEDAVVSEVVEDFEVDELFAGSDSGGLQIGHVTWGDAPGNVTIELVPAEGDLALPEQDGDNTVLQVTYDIGSFGGFTHALTDGEEWVSQDWTEYDALEFWLYGANSEAMIQVEIFDNRAPDAVSDSAERFFYRFLDDFEGWQFFSIPFVDFERRSDWQPEGAPSDGLGLTEVHGYAFSFPAGVGEFTNYIDDVQLAFTDAGEAAVPTSTPIELPEYNPDGEWQLVWSDEFESDAGAPISAEFWTCEVGGWGWGNQQLEHNTDRTDNVAHDGEGHLVITAREEAFRGNEYTSGRCNTKDKVEFAFGRVEARIDLPEGQGIWPAFWMLGAEFPETDWPDAGEIDIMEYIGAEPRSIHGTIHGPGYSGSSGFGMRYIMDEPVATDFHVFAIEWEPDVIRWLVNDIEFHTMTPDTLYDMGPWVYNQPYFMLINVAVGGLWPGNPNDSTVFPQEMLVDWVRVYQRVAEE